jgi:hypothetical protein
MPVCVGPTGPAAICFIYTRSKNVLGMTVWGDHASFIDDISNQYFDAPSRVVQ